LYFVLAGAIDYFRYLKIGLSVVLVFIGAKMLLDPHDHEPKWFQFEISTLFHCSSSLRFYSPPSCFPSQPRSAKEKPAANKKASQISQATAPLPICENPRNLRIKCFSSVLSVFICG